MRTSSSAPRPAESLTSLAIIIPTYGRQQSLNSLLRSVAAQDLPPTEVILVDQNTNGTIDAIVTAYQDLPLVHIRRAEPNAAAARNTGFRASRSKYVVFLDDDEVIEPGFARALLDTFSRNPSVFAIWPHVHGPGDAPPPPNRPLSPARRAGAGGIAFERSYFQQCGGYDELLFRTAGLAEDLELFRRMHRLGMTVYSSSRLSVVHDSSVAGGCGLRTQPYEEVRRRAALGLLLARRLNNPDFEIRLSDFCQLTATVFLRPLGRQGSFRKVLLSPFWHLRLLLDTISGTTEFVRQHEARYATAGAIDHIGTGTVRAGDETPSPPVLDGPRHT